MRFRKPSLAFGEGYISVEEYLEKENASTTKHEYFRGRVYDWGDPDPTDIDDSKTIPEYLELERISPDKHEYFQGRIVKMDNEETAHEAIVNKIYNLLRSRSKNDLHVYRKTRIHVENTTLFTYPDITVVNIQPIISEVDNTSITNPDLLVEVSSAFTNYYDKGEKVQLYRDIPSLKEYVIADPETRSLESWFINNTGHWELRTYSGTDTFHSYSLEIDIPLADIFKVLQ